MTLRRGSSSLVIINFSSGCPIRDHEDGFCLHADIADLEWFPFLLFCDC